MAPTITRPAARAVYHRTRDEDPPHRRLADRHARGPRRRARARGAGGAAARGRARGRRGGGAVLLPSPCTARASTEDPTLRLPAGDPSKIRIGVAHGSLRGCGFEVEPDDFPIAADAAERAGVDYLALGHWHSTLVLPRAD